MPSAAVRNVEMDVSRWSTLQNTVSTKWTVCCRRCSRHLASFDDCVDALPTRRFDGLGYMFAWQHMQPFNSIGIDLDGCLVNGTLAVWASSIVSRLRTYTEVSPSQTGVKLFGRTRNPWTYVSSRKLLEPAITPKRPGIEVYTGRRYFCVTGMPYGEMLKVRDITDDLDWLADHFGMSSRLIDAPQIPARKRQLTLTDMQPSRDCLRRGSAYLSAMDPCISGQGGHNRLYRASSKLFDFGCSEEEAFALLSEYNLRCEPPWSERELLHKIKSVWSKQQRTPSL